LRAKVLFFILTNKFKYQNILNLITLIKKKLRFLVYET
jgi:hypothetical protein